MKSLFEEITSYSTADDFELHFKILNLSGGYEIIHNLDCETETLNKLIQWTAFCYSYESPLLRKKKERWDVKISVAEYLGIDMDSYILECFRNNNEIFNNYITWWLKETADRDFALLISGEELFHNLLQTARTGVEKKEVTAKNEREAEKVMKMFFKTESTLKAEAYKEAIEIKESIEKQIKVIQRNYEYLEGVVRKELPLASANMNWQEMWTHKNRKK